MFSSAVTQIRHEHLPDHYDLSAAAMPSVAVAAEPRTLLTDDTAFGSPEEAERAGYEILELLERAAVVDAAATSTEPPAE